LPELLQHIKVIIWDWNGTLLDDAGLAVYTMNEMLSRRNLPEMSMQHYKQVFSFPVKDYYQKIGFDFEQEPFEIPALEFIVRYNEMVNECQLHDDAVSILNHFYTRNCRQFILSAMKQDTLDQCLIHFRINHFFEHVSGLDDHYANSKAENGHRLVEHMQLNPEQVLLIGDTIHDFDVATELGCNCVLVANGHQSREVLEETGAFVVDRLSQLLH
jgi:phosphoglycolate phosphatase